MGSSAAQQFRDVISKRIEEYVKKESQRICFAAAKAFMDEIDTAHGFFDVTGNLYQSFAVGVYLDGTLIGITRVGGKDPLMPSLDEGQYFPFKVYYNGISVNGRPYVGETDNGGQWGPEESEYFLESFRPKSTKGFALVVVAGMDYAEFVESKANHDVLSKLRDDAIRIFEKSV